ncbi:TMEM175 family protein [Streptomyces sp. NPDC101151]|uniref:TMEM175 family protein n=1 Tax=Streptomyces sp. NPDC101151 TaxID=3366115 RepID=UPI0037F3BE4C
MSKRIEAFTDRAFAFAFALLILVIPPPEETGHNLTETLVHQWSSYLTYVVGLVVIGAMWINNHAFFTEVRRTDRTLTLLNLLLLMVVSALFWSTGFLAGRLREGQYATYAALLYGVLVTIHALVHTAMWRHVTRRVALSHPKPSPAEESNRVPLTVGFVAYPAALALSLFSPVAMLVTYGLLAVYYALNPVSAPRGA